LFKKTFCMVIALLSLFSFYDFVYCSRPSSRLKSGPLKQVGCLDFGVAYDVWVVDETAYVTGNRGVQIIDVHDPESPRKLGFIRLRDGAFGVLVENNTAYIAGDEEGFFIADVSDPQNPVIIGQYSKKKGVTVNVSINGKYAYLVMREGRLLVLDIHDEEEPRLLADIHVGDAGTDMFLHKNFLYVSDHNSGLVIFDASEPSSPKKLSVVPGTRGVFGIDIKEDLLFLGCHNQGLRILDVSDPSFPRMKGTFSFSSEANNVISDKNYLYVADQNDGIIHILDVRDPSRPISLASIDGYMPHRMFCGRGYLYVADGKFGLVIFKYDR
jgi:hypothetical protein